MIIDAHTHMVNSRYFDQLIDKGGKWGKEGVDWVVERAQRKPHFTDVPLRLAQLDRNGIALQVVTPYHLFDSNLLPGDVATQLAYLWFMSAFFAFYLFGYLAFAVVFLLLFLKFYSAYGLKRSLTITAVFALGLWMAFSLFLKLDIWGGSFLF